MLAMTAETLTPALKTLWQHFLDEESQLTDIQRQAIRDALTGKTVAARDLLWAGIGQSPRAWSLYVTLTELLLVAGEYEHAKTLWSRLHALTEFENDSAIHRAVKRLSIYFFEKLETETIADLADLLLTEGNSSEQDAYLPLLIEALAKYDHDQARQLAQRWYEHTKQPRAWWISLQLHLRLTGHLPDTSPEPSPLPQDGREWALFFLWQAVRSFDDGIEALQQLLQGVRQGAIAPDGILETLQPLLATFPASLPAPLVTGSIWFAGGNANAALQAGETLQVALDWRMQLLGHALTGYTLLALGRHQAAIEPLQKAMAVLEEHPEGLGKLATLLTPPVTLSNIAEVLLRLLLQAGLLDEFAALAARLLTAETLSLTQAQAYARLLTQRGANQHARRILRAIAERQYKRRDTQGYTQTLRDLVTLEPENAALRETLVQAAATLGTEPALRLLEDLALQLSTRGHRDAAIGLLQRATELALLSPTTWPHVPRLYDQLITFSPEDLTLRHAAVTALIQVGQRGKAKAQLREIARLALARNEPESALAALHQVVALDPQDPEGYHRLGELLVSLGEIEQAERVYRRLLALVPDDATAQARQAALAQLRHSSAS